MTATTTERRRGNECELTDGILGLANALPLGLAPLDLLLEFAFFHEIHAAGSILGRFVRECVLM